MLIACLIGIAAAGVASCGGKKAGKLLNPSESAEMIEDLNNIEASIAARDCRSAEANLAQLETVSSSLGTEVDENLRNTISDGVARLRSLLLDKCQAKTVNTTPTTVPTTTAETTTAETTPPETTTRTTTTQSTTVPEPEPPPDGGGGGGNDGDGDNSGGVSPPSENGGGVGGR